MPETVPDGRSFFREREVTALVTEPGAVATGIKAQLAGTRSASFSPIAAT